MRHSIETTRSREVSLEFYQLTENKRRIQRILGFSLRSMDRRVTKFRFSSIFRVEKSFSFSFYSHCFARCLDNDYRRMHHHA